MKKPPKDWEDLPEFKDRCTCKEYEWEENVCPYQDEINDKIYVCNCCPFCHQQCADDI